MNQCGKNIQPKTKDSVESYEHRSREIEASAMEFSRTGLRSFSANKSLDENSSPTGLGALVVSQHLAIRIFAIL